MARASATRQRHALALAAGQLMDLPLAEMVHLHHFQRRLYAPVALTRSLLAQAQRIGHVLGNTHVREQRIVLEDHAHVTLVRWQGEKLHAIYPDAARVGTDETRQNVQQGGFPRPRGAEQGQEFTGPHIKGNVIDGDE